MTFFRNSLEKVSHLIGRGAKIPCIKNISNFLSQRIRDLHGLVRGLHHC